MLIQVSESYYAVAAAAILALAAFNLGFRLDAEIVTEWDEAGVRAQRVGHVQERRLDSDHVLRRRRIMDPQMAPSQLAIRPVVQSHWRGPSWRFASHRRSRQGSPCWRCRVDPSEPSDVRWRCSRVWSWPPASGFFTRIPGGVGIRTPCLRC